MATTAMISPRGHTAPTAYDGDPVFRLRVALGGEQMPNPSSEELHGALMAMARVEAGEPESLDGMAGWLMFLLRLPDESDHTAGDLELAQTIRGAMDHVREHPELPEDSLTAMECIVNERGHGVINGSERGAVGTMPARSNPALVFRADATPPFEAFNQLSENREFRKTWDHKRRDLPDQSTDTYDLELARFAHREGWTDQQIVDLLVWHRVRQIEPQKDVSYYVDLLAKARSAATADASSAACDSDPKLLDVLNRALGIAITKIVKYGGNGGTFELQLASGHKVDLGTTTDVLSQRHVKASVADATTDVVPSYKQPQWDKIASAIFKCAGPAPIEEAPEQIEMDWLLRSSLNHVAITDIDERDRAGLSKAIRDSQDGGKWAFRDQDGRVMIHMGGFLSFSRLKHGVLLSFREGSKRLRKMKFIPRDLEGKADSKGKPRINVWVAPRGWDRE